VQGGTVKREQVSYINRCEAEPKSNSNPNFNYNRANPINPNPANRVVLHGTAARYVLSQNQKSQTCPPPPNVLDMFH